VQAALVVEGAERDAVARRIAAARGAELDVMAVQVPPRRAAGNSAAIAVALDHRVGAARARVAQRPGEQRAVEQSVEDLAVLGNVAALGPQLRSQRLTHRGEEHGDVVRNPPRQLLRRLGVDVGRTRLSLRGRDRVLRPLRMELAALPGEAVAGPQQERAFDVLREPPHADAPGPGHPGRPPLAVEVEQEERERAFRLHAIVGGPL
jgi:hypothetical protein